MSKAIRKFALVALALLSSASFAVTYTPLSLISPAGSTAGQFIGSTGPTTSAAWTTVTLSGLGGLARSNNLSDVASVATARSNIGAAPTASPSFTGAMSVTNSATSGGTLTIAAASNTSNGVQILLTGNGATTPAKYMRVLSGVFGILNNAGSVQILSLDDAGDLAVSGSLSAAGNDALQYSNTSGQALPTGSLVTVTSWTKTFDRLSTSFNAATGIYTAPATGFYRISGQLNFAAGAGVVAAQYSAVIVANAVPVVTNSIYQESTSSVPVTVDFNAVVALAAGQTLSVQAFQGSGSARALQSGAASYLSINRIP
jgi:hypothetical protein